MEETCCLGNSHYNLPFVISTVVYHTSLWCWGSCLPQKISSVLQGGPRQPKDIPPIPLTTIHPKRGDSFVASPAGSTPGWSMGRPTLHVEPPTLSAGVWPRDEYARLWEGQLLPSKINITTLPLDNYSAAASWLVLSSNLAPSQRTLEIRQYQCSIHETSYCMGSM